MPRILHIMHFVPKKRGALELFLLEYAKASRAKGIDNTFVFSGEPIGWFKDALLTCALYHVVPGNPVKTCYRETRGIVHSTKADVTTFWFVPIFHRNSLLLVWQQRPGKAIFFDRTSWKVPERRGLKCLLAWMRGQLLSRFYWRIVSVSKHNRWRNVHRTFMDTKRTCVIHNACLPIQVSEPSHAAANSYFFFVGQIDKKKGVFTLIKAYGKLYRKIGISCPWLKLAGQGPHMEDCQRLVVDMGLDKSVLFLGLRNDVPQLMTSALATIVPSEWAEAFGFVAVEAMFSGRPLIVSDAGALPEVVGDTATVFPRGNIDALAEIMGKILADPLSYNELAQKAKRRAESHFTLDRMVNDYVQLFEEALAKGRKTT